MATLISRGGGDETAWVSLLHPLCHSPQLLPPLFLFKRLQSPPSYFCQNPAWVSGNKNPCVPAPTKGGFASWWHSSLATRSPRTGCCVGICCLLWLSQLACPACGPGLSPLWGNPPHPWFVIVPESLASTSCNIAFPTSLKVISVPPCLKVSSSFSLTLIFQGVYSPISNLCLDLRLFYLLEMRNSLNFQT